MTLDSRVPAISLNGTVAATPTELGLQPVDRACGMRPGSNILMSYLQLDYNHGTIIQALSGTTVLVSPQLALQALYEEKVGGAGGSPCRVTVPWCYT